MRAHLKCHSSKEPEKKLKPQSCVIIISVKIATGHKNVPALADTVSSATGSNKDIVNHRMSNKKEKAVE